MKDRKVKTVVCDKVECERWCVTKEDGVCVYIIGADHSGDCTQRSYPLVLEAESDQLCVPAISISVLCPFRFPSWQPAKPRTGMSFSNGFQIKRLYGFRNLTELHQNKL